MAIAEFPMVSVSSSNPFPLFFQMMPESFQVGFTEYDDGGRDFRLQNGGNGVKRWILKYDGLTEALALILDAHMLLAKLSPDGLSANSFNFRDQVTGILYSGVRYEKYEATHIKRATTQARTITLVKFP